MIRTPTWHKFMSQFTILQVVIGKGVLVSQSQLVISWIVIQNCAKIGIPNITLYTHYYTIIHLNLIRKPILQPKIVLLNFALFIYIKFKSWNVTFIIVILLLNHISVIFRSTLISWSILVYLCPLWTICKRYQQ